MHFYAGNYAQYLKQKDERRATLIAAHKKSARPHRAVGGVISRFRYQATRRSRCNRGQGTGEDREDRDPERGEDDPLLVPAAEGVGADCGEFKGVTIGVWDEGCPGQCRVRHRARRARCAGGHQRGGKSTLIKLLAADEPLTRGEYVIGHNVTPDYFAQDQYKALDPEAKLLDDLFTVSNGKTITELRSLLGCFLFSEDDVFKPIGVLSGGERNRYALARIVEPGELPLLDEPTNHLDLRAKDVLLQSLQEFSGTVVFVSHDRYFIDRLATKVFEIAGGEVRVYPGNYEDYLWRKQGSQRRDRADGRGSGSRGRATGSG